MDDSFNRNLFLVKEHTGLFKAANNYDIYDPETGKTVLECREENLGVITKIARFTDYKRMTPFNVEIRLPGGPTLISVKRGFALLGSKVEVLDETGTLIGGFVQKLLSIGGKFEVQDATGQPVCMLEGKWSGWEFKFLKDKVQLAQVSKKWAGLGKEMFTSADNYMLSIEESVPKNDPVRPLILAAVVCIDMVLKE